MRGCAISHYRHVRFRTGRRRVLSALVLPWAALITFAAGLAMSGQEQGPAPEGLLPQILEKTSEYCARLERVSLDFVCREAINERQYSPPVRLFGLGGPGHGTRVSLEYDYQLVRSGASVVEKRTLLRENGRPRNEPNAALKTKLFKHRYLVFGPVGLLGGQWQLRHSYAYLGEDTVDKEKAFVIEADPAGAEEPDLLYGKVWVRQRDFTIVKAAWDQHSLGNFEAARKMAESIGHGAEPRISIVVYYGVEKNGIRFLSSLTVHEDYDSKVGVLRASETEVLYKDYKFFVVETEVRY